MRLFRLRKNDLARESNEWVRDGLIDENQAEAICRRYGIDYQQSETHSLGYRVLVGFGYLFVGLALITFLSANWDEIPRAIRMAGLVILTLGTQLLGLRKYHLQQPAPAVGLMFLGNLFYGASIILIAQIYHLGEHMPDGVFWWALGTLPFALITRSRLLMLLTLTLAIIWFVLETSLGFYPAGFVLFILGAVYVLMRAGTSLTLFLMTFAAITLWYEYSLSQLWRHRLHFDFDSEHLACSAALVIFAHAFSLWLARSHDTRAKDYGALLSVWSLRFGLLSLIFMSYEEPWRWLIKANWSHLPSMMIVVSALSLGAIWFAAQAKSIINTLIPMSLNAVALAWVLISREPDDALFLQVASNLVLVTTAILLIVKGLKNGISHYFILGVGSLLITALLRYIDLIGDYVGGAVLFMVFAAILLGAARYWRQSTKGPAHD